jgi:peptidylprolyl isomerase
MVKLLVITLLSYFCSSLCAHEPEKPKSEVSREETLKLSQAFGNFIGKNLKNPGMNFDLEGIITGIRDGAAGKPSPMTEQEYQKALAKVQEQAIAAMSQENLTKANAFLLENGKGKNMVQLMDGKLQYEILAEGNGPEVKEHGTPQVHFTGRFIDGTVFGSSEQTGGPIPINIDQTIPGFSKGLLGMKEGERRRLYIHPELGYGAAGQLPPNSLLIFEIEIVKADSSQDDDDMFLSDEYDDEDYDDEAQALLNLESIIDEIVEDQRSENERTTQAHTIESAARKSAHS